jgi:ubiquinone/menaquinone biosynthesis C-methylase UbiE
MKMEMLVPTPEVMKELRKILRVEARFAVLLEQEVEAKELALKRTKDLLKTARQLADMKRSDAWRHWRKHIEGDGKTEQLNQMRKKNMVNSPGSKFGGN